MNKTLLRSTFCIVFVVLFSVFSVFADFKTLSASNITQNFSLTGWGYFRNPYGNIAFEQSTYNANISANYPVLKTGSTLYGSYNNIIVGNYRLTFDTSHRFNTFTVNVPLYVRNVSSYSLDFYLCVTAYSGLDYYSSMDKTRNNRFDCQSVIAYGFDQPNIRKVQGDFTNNGSLAFSRKADLSDKIFIFRRYTLTGVCPSDNAVKYLELTFDFPYDNAFVNPSTSSLNVLLGIVPDSAIFEPFDTQMGILHDDMESIESAIKDNANRLSDIEEEIGNSTDRILYEVSPDQEVELFNFNHQNQELSERQDRLIEDLSQADEYMNDDEVADITNPQNLLPEDFDENTQEITGVLGNVFENTPLEMMMIISLSLALVSYILFGKKGSA